MRSGNPHLAWLWKHNRREAVQIIEATLFSFEGEVRGTAEGLNIDRTTLNRWIAEDETLQYTLANARIKYLKGR